MGNPFINPYLQEYFKEKRGELLFTHQCKSGTIVDVYRAVGGPPDLVCVPDWHCDEAMLEDGVLKP
jgi:hypothetical protein